MTSERRVDHNQIRTNQMFIIGLLALAFVLDLPALAALTGVAMLISALYPPAGLFHRIYRHIVRPLNLVPRDVRVDNPEPHRFAQFVGGTCVTAGILIVAAGLPLAGWALVGLVIVLASLNLFAGWCAGCMMYYWLNRAGVPGFDRTPIEVSS